MLKISIFVGIIWCLIRIITIIIILSGQAGTWSPLYGIGHIIAVIQGKVINFRLALMVHLDVRLSFFLVWRQKAQIKKIG